MAMDSVQVQEKLSAHESACLTGAHFETRYFDNGQSITRFRSKVKVEPENGEPRIEDTAIEVERDYRLGRGTLRSPRGEGGIRGGVNFGYPELSFFIDELEGACRGTHRRRSGILDTSMGVLATALGHGNMHPRNLLRPSVLTDILKSVTIGHSQAHYDLVKLKEYFKTSGRLINTDPLTEAKDEMVGFIGIPQWSDRSPRRSTMLQIHVFNPKDFTRAENGHSQTYPDNHNRYFEFSIFCEDEETKERRSPEKTIFSAWPCTTYFYNNLEKDIGEGLDAGGFFFKVDERLISKLRGAAPLPVTESECGKQNGLASLERKFMGVSASEIPESRKIALTELEEFNREAEAFINEEVGWHPAPDPKLIDKAIAMISKESGDALIIRAGYEDKSVAYKFVPAEKVLAVRHAIDCSELDGNWGGWGGWGGWKIDDFRFTFLDPRLYRRGIAGHR